MASKALTHNDYTVGWVCALSKEQTAATVMLDEEHGDLPKPPNDHNTYTLGCIGKHNIVIACLPEGEIGNNAAAIVATRMTSTFPSIKFGLMVGIGGGVPPTVRLGDVVVSIPADGFGGVVQWDLGKAEQDDTFKRTGALNSPPNVLRTVLTKLKTKYEIKGSMIPQYLEDLKANYPRMAAKYTRSESLEDVLFRANYNHVEKYDLGDRRIPDNAGGAGIRDDKEGEEEDEEDEEGDEEEDEEGKGCINCDRSKIVKRKARDMRVHYGLIASGNQVIKDAAFRDKVNKRLGGGVLCFEMEAAGLMNEFPCIVIRGICDYADSHKNKAWQEHAAAVAAAFAKEFLLMVPVYEVGQLPTIANVLDNIAKLSEDVADLKHAAISAKHKTILNWLSNVDPSSNYNEARKQRTPTTGDWFLKSQRYAEWIRCEVPMFWLYGIPGCGKTVISSTIIESLYLLDLKANIAYFYFDFNDVQKQTVEGCLRSLLRHLSARELPAVVETLHEQTQQRNTQPGLDALMDALEAVLQQAARTFLVFDALDECKEVKPLMEKIAEIKRWELPGVSILATSRREPDIMETMDVLVPQSICLETALVDEDIKTFVKQSLERDGPLKRRWSSNAKAKQEIIDAFTAGSKGMFRWAVCQLDALENCLNLSMLRKTLESLPETLDETYERILLKIDPNHRQMAVKILQWLAYSTRPPRIKEIVEVLAVDVEENPRFDTERRFPEPRDILTVCSSLVSISAETTEGSHSKIAEMEVRLAHFSVKEYLVSERIRLGKAERYSIREIPAHTSIAEICLAYLLQFDTADFLTDQTTKEFPLARYAAEFWTLHAQVAREDAKVMHQLIMELFLSNRDTYVNWVRLSDPDNPQKEPVITRSWETVASPLYYASLNGLIESVRLLLEKGVDVNAQGGDYGNALQAASLMGDDQIVELLLEQGTDVNVQGGCYCNALHAALVNGHDQIAQRLLEKGADVNSPAGTKYGTALQAASYHGYNEIVQLLLEKGADVNAQGGDYGNALQAASSAGYDQTVQLLLEKGADVNAQNGDVGNALQLASFGGYEQIVKRLLEKEADVNAQGGYYGNALQAASYQGHEQIVQLLLENGADVNAQGGEFGNALHAASSKGHHRIVQRLLEKGANVNAPRRYFYGTTLQAASSGGHDQIVQLLLEKGADVNAQGNFHYGKALYEASDKGHDQIVQLLLEKGADINAQGGTYGNALQAASYHGYNEIVQLLLEKGADVNAQGGRYGTALQTASSGGYGQIVQLLLEKGADINAQNGEVGNALQLASSFGYNQIVQLLLEKGADVNAHGGGYGNALQAASYQGHEQIVQLLLEKGGDVNAPGEGYGKALYAASIKGRHQIVQLLLEKGADVNAQSGYFLNALQAASSQGHGQIVQRLLEEGAVYPKLRFLGRGEA